jgi:hypothetical protein
MLMLVAVYVTTIIFGIGLNIKKSRQMAGLIHFIFL